MQFVDLKQQYDRYRDEMMLELEQVLSSSAFINGPAVRELEGMLADFAGVRHAIGCSNGTDALVLGLMALEVQRGDEIIVPDFTFIATAEAVALMGATPVFVDISPETYNIDPEAVRYAVSERTVGIIPVSLYGQVPEMDELVSIARERRLWIIEDAAQSFGARYKTRRSCSLTDIATTSFFPAKPLGAYGDGGALFTNDDELAARLRMILNHGQRRRYDHVMIGLNARLDTIQAAVLKVKLRHFEEEIESRQRVAGEYTRRLQHSVQTPIVREYNHSVWAQYTVRLPQRDQVQASMKEAGVPTSVHYPIPLHRQEVFANAQTGHADNPCSVAAAAEVLSLPMHPFLSEEEIELVCGALKSALERSDER